MGRQWNFVRTTTLRRSIAAGLALLYRSRTQYCQSSSAFGPARSKGRKFLLEFLIASVPVRSLAEVPTRSSTSVIQLYCPSVYMNVNWYIRIYVRRTLADDQLAATETRNMVGCDAMLTGELY